MRVLCPRPVKVDEKETVLLTAWLEGAREQLSECQHLERLIGTR